MARAHPPEFRGTSDFSDHGPAGQARQARSDSGRFATTGSGLSSTTATATGHCWRR